MGEGNIPTWGSAQAQIREAVEFLCRGKIGTERAEVIDRVIFLVRSIGRGSEPPLESSPLAEQDQHARESWARGAARDIVGGAMRTAERLPRADQTFLLREIAKLALWQIPNSHDEVRQLTKWLDMQNLSQPHP